MSAVASENIVTLRKLVVAAVAMFGFGFLLVPFYNKICEVAGLNRVVERDEVVNTQVDTSRFLTIEFDANARNDLPWRFAPLERSVRIHPGALTQITYEVRNDAAVPVVLQAIPSYGPQYAAQYFRKLDCFCFKQQRLAPGEVRQMPVVFVIDPKAPADLGTVTLSYTFFEVEGTTGGKSAAVPVGERG
ncbi:MAG: cytochrome c oxidase assembly protein [Betaproteobacteria bacterium]|nr:cytochrome c oxidase assembly protein [Betaproteobacteria bacterium]